jgi:hypothetical protein
MLLLSKLKLE